MPVANLDLSEECTEGANRPPKVSQGRALVKFLLIGRIAESLISRQEICTVTRQGDAGRSAAAGRA